MKIVKVCKDGRVVKIEKILDVHDLHVELTSEKVLENCEPIEVIHVPETKVEPFEYVNVILKGWGKIKLISDLDEFEFEVFGKRIVTIPPGVYIVVKDGKYKGIEVILRNGQEIDF